MVLVVLRSGEKASTPAPDAKDAIAALVDAKAEVGDVRADGLCELRSASAVWDASAASERMLASRSATLGNWERSNLLPRPPSPPPLTLALTSPGGLLSPGVVRGGNAAGMRSSHAADGVRGRVGVSTDAGGAGVGRGGASRD